MSFDSPQVATRIWNDPQQPQSTTPRNGQFGHFKSNSQHSVDSNASSPPLYPESPETFPADRHCELPVYKGTKGRHSRPGTAFHPYKSSPNPPALPQLSLPPAPPPSNASQSKPIQFIDATFQPGDSSNHMQTTAGGLALCRPKRKKITSSQLSKLLEVFETTDNPGFELRDSVGKEIEMSNREVQVWFQNRRAKVTRERASALEKANTSRPRLLSNEKLPSSSRSTPTPESTQASAQHQWRVSNSQPSQPLPPSSNQPLERSSSSDVVPRYRKMFGDHRILLPRSSSPLPSPEVSSAASEASSYFTNSLTPPLSYTPTTPGVDSPTCSTRPFPFSENHVRPEDPSHFLPFGSPSAAFGQLALRSPPFHSALVEREPFFNAIEMPSPPPPEPQEFIRLAPIRTSWDASTTPKTSSMFMGGRRRSLSTPDLLRGGSGGGGGGVQSMNEVKRTTSPQAHMRLPSIRDLLQPVVSERMPITTPALTPSISNSSSSASPITPVSGSPFDGGSSRVSTPLRPPLSARHTTDVVPSMHRPVHRRLPSNEGGLTGLGVNYASRTPQHYTHHPPQPRAHSMYNPY